MLDIETLGVESSAVILSAAIIHWQPTDDFTYDELVQRAIFVKFDAKNQVDMGRTIDKGTLAWWEKQGEYQKKRSFKRNPAVDVAALDGITRLAAYVKMHNSENNAVWVRGSLDQVCVDSLARQLGVDSIAPYNAYRDVRTAIDLLTETGKGTGYCKVDKVPMGFNEDKVIKHDPVHDCAYDIIQMRYGV
jgi:hypothetical protein